MDDPGSFSPRDFGASFKGFLDHMAAQAPAADPPFLGRLRELFGVDPRGLPIVAASFELADHPNLHLAIEAYLSEPGRSAELLGVHSEHALRTHVRPGPPRRGDGPRPSPGGTRFRRPAHGDAKAQRLPRADTFAERRSDGRNRSALPPRTVFVITGRGVGLIEASCRMARLLQPATVILEDVDMVAEERTRQASACTTLLFELLNQMDGLADDADVMFLLTTNRPEILEPALAARPGRIDQAVEVPLPDSDCRRRLFQLYTKGISLQLDSIEPFIARTEGVSAAFIREVMRKAALFAADEADELSVRDRHMDQALHELLVDGGELTRSLLGARRAAP